MYVNVPVLVAALREAMNKSADGGVYFGRWPAEKLPNKPRGIRVGYYYGCSHTVTLVVNKILLVVCILSTELCSYTVNWLLFQSSLTRCRCKLYTFFFYVNSFKVILLLKMSRPK